MDHLNTERFARLLERPNAEPELYAHLEGGCDACEAFLAQSPHPLLDGATDAALVTMAVSPAADDARAEETYRRIRPPPASRRWLVAIAALLLAVVAAFLLRPRDEGGLKGLAPVTLELQAAVKTGEQLTRVEPGQTVPASGVLLLRYHCSASARAKVVVVRGATSQTLGEVELESGTHDLTRDGSPLGLSLEGERGPMRVRLELESTAAEIQVNVAP